MHQLEKEINNTINRNEDKILKIIDRIMEATKLLVALDMGSPIIAEIKAKLEQKDKQQLPADSAEQKEKEKTVIMLSPHKYASDLLRLDHFDGNNLNVNFDIFIGKSFLEFNNIIGLPVKNGIEHPIYDYELNVIKAIEENNNIWIKKARGIGVTELVLRYLTWKIVSSTELDHKKIMLVSGTREDHANNVKERIESLFDKNFSHVQLESKYTELWLKKTWIKVMPSRNVKDLRGYTDVSYLFIDEADYFENSVNDELLHAITAYEEKVDVKQLWFQHLMHLVDCSKL